MQLGDLSTSRYLKTRASIVAFFLREGKREKEKEKKRKEKNGKNHIFIPCSMDSYRSHRRRNHEFEIGAVGNKPIKKENP